MKLRLSSVLVLFYALVLFSLNSHATTVTYDVTNVSGNTWKYVYTVNNDMLNIDIEEFTIFFDASLYENLNVASAPAGWDPLVIQPDTSLPDDGFYDVLALGLGIAPSTLLSGFSVEFDFLGAGIPSSQLFDIIDPNNFSIIESGTTSPVPIPGAIILMLSGLAALRFRIHNKIAMNI